MTKYLKCDDRLCKREWKVVEGDKFHKEKEPYIRCPGLNSNDCHSIFLESDGLECCICKKVLCSLCFEEGGKFINGNSYCGNCM